LSCALQSHRSYEHDAQRGEALASARPQTLVFQVISEAWLGEAGDLGALG
jgi:hypothetical protein